MADSSEGDPGTPPAGGGGGGGGSPQFFDYYVPLIFNSSHADGKSIIQITFIQPSVLITTFAQDKAGVTQSQIRTPQTIILDPDNARGLTNGSLIRTTSPVQVIVQRNTQDISWDHSFSYTILPIRMAGYEYRAPFDGFIAIFTKTQDTQVNIRHRNGTVKSGRIFIPNTMKMFSVTSGAYINTSRSTIGAFYTTIGGYKASMAVPKFLRGKDYIFSGNLYNLNNNQVDLSKIRIFTDHPTELQIQYVNNQIKKLAIFGDTVLPLTSSIRGIKSLRGDISVSVEINIAYGGILRSSSVELMAAPEMRAGELFAYSSGFSESFSVINQQTNMTLLHFDTNQYRVAYRDIPVYSKYDTHEILTEVVPSVLVANHSLFGIGTSPGKIGNPMSPSMAYLPLPLNSQTLFRNVTGVKSTWYRFIDLAVNSITFFPKPPEEFSSQTIIVKIVSNGSLPAGEFVYTVTIDGKEVAKNTVTFLPVNNTIELKFNQFLPFDTKTLSVVVSVDINNQVNEITKNDNNLSINVPVVQNLRLRGTFYLVLTIIAVLTGRYFYRKYKEKQTEEEGRVDMILTIEEQEGEN